jgi:hypothetical protein
MRIGRAHLDPGDTGLSADLRQLFRDEAFLVCNPNQQPVLSWWWVGHGGACQPPRSCPRAMRHEPSVISMSEGSCRWQGSLKACFLSPPLRRRWLARSPRLAPPLAATNPSSPRRAYVKANPAPCACSVLPAGTTMPARPKRGLIAWALSAAMLLARPYSLAYVCKRSPILARPTLRGLTASAAPEGAPQVCMAGKPSLARVSYIAFWVLCATTGGAEAKAGALGCAAYRVPPSGQLSGGEAVVPSVSTSPEAEMSLCFVLVSPTRQYASG